MSRVGKKPIKIPEGVEIDIKDRKVSIKGSKGEATYQLPQGITLKKKNNYLLVSLEYKSHRLNSNWGLARSLINNRIIGVSEGFQKNLEIHGIGYGANVKDEGALQLDLGFSHPIRMEIPEGINIEVKKNIITISGTDKEKVGQFAADIRKVRPPEPYKGKGIRYSGEKVRIKEGKKAM